MASVRMWAVGPGGMLARIVAAAGLYWLAFADKRGLTWFVAFLGLVVFPGVLLAAQALRSRVSPAPLRATGPVGHAVNAAIIVGLFVLPFPPDVRDAVALFYGASMLVAAWRGYAGCEVLAIPNWLLGRDDQVGCLIFSPLDELEVRVAGRKFANSAQ
jgi:hypothetical protein